MDLIKCGKPLKALENKKIDDEHFIKILTVRMYPEQDSAVRFPKMFGGKLYFYCNNHGLFEYRI